MTRDKQPNGGVRSPTEIQALHQEPYGIAGDHKIEHNEPGSRGASPTLDGFTRLGTERDLGAVHRSRIGPAQLRAPDPQGPHRDL